ncbi:hypothetical protein BJX68DRAFT_31793 [Aspergillus pseudodeflectus]|uniref:Secreted protein n=1 Tax=Aspergillus pseudodeflectus TaxID=176178 RepID=A0ABR4KQY3_9EURO
MGLLVSQCFSSTSWTRICLSVSHPSSYTDPPHSSADSSRHVTGQQNNHNGDGILLLNRLYSFHHRTYMLHFTRGSQHYRFENVRSTAKVEVHLPLSCPNHM